MRNSHGRNSKERGREKGLDPFESRGETTTEKERKEKMGAASSEVAASNLSLSPLSAGLRRANANTTLGR